MRASVALSLLLLITMGIIVSRIIESRMYNFKPDDSHSLFYKHTIRTDGKSLSIWLTPEYPYAGKSRANYVIYLAGGPNASVNPGDLPKWFLRIIRNLSSSNIRTVIVEYAGTRARSYFPDANLPEAIDDVRMVLRFIRDQSSSASICFLGDSLGGFIVLKAILDSEIRSGISGYVLINPLVTAPERQFNAFLEERDGRRLWYWTISQFERHQSGDKYIGEVDELRYEIFRNFFGPADFSDPISEVGNDTLFRRVFLSKDRESSRMENIQFTKKLWPRSDIINTWSRGHSLDEYIILRTIDEGRMSKEIGSCFKGDARRRLNHANQSVG